MNYEEIYPELIKRGIYSVADYFRELFLKERLGGNVAVIVKDYTTSFFFMPCDKFGYPKYREQRYLSFIDTHIKLYEEGSNPSVDMGKVIQKTIVVKYPLIHQEIAYNFPSEHFIFLWEGEMVDSREISAEDLDVRKLMELTNNAIEKREGIIIDEVLKNRLIK